MARTSSVRDARRDLALAIQAASDKKAENIVALDLRGEAWFTD